MNICRTCLARDEILLNFSSRVSFTEPISNSDWPEAAGSQPPTIYDLLKVICSNLDLDETEFGLSKCICAGCFRLLSNAFNFRIKSKNSENILLKDRQTVVLKNQQDEAYYYNDTKEANEDPLIGYEDEEKLLEEFIDTNEKVENIDSFDENVASNKQCDYNSDANIKDEILYDEDAEQNIEYLDDNYEEKEENSQNYFGDSAKDGELKIELVDKNSGRIKHTCNICFNTFDRIGTLSVHMRSHNGEKPFQCDICNKSFSQKGILLTHMLGKHINKRHLCSICGKKFARPSFLARHMLIHKDVRLYQCDECPMKFFEKCIFVQHKYRKHTTTKDFVCSICAKAFVSDSYLKTHMLIHDKPFKCPKCKLEFCHRYKFHQHLQLQHSIDVDISQIRRWVSIVPLLKQK